MDSTEVLHLVNSRSKSEDIKEVDSKQQEAQSLVTTMLKATGE